MLLIIICFKYDINECNESKLNWSKANYEQIKSHLSNLDWTLLLNAYNIKDNWNIFRDVLDKTGKTF